MKPLSILAAPLSALAGLLLAASLAAQAPVVHATGDVQFYGTATGEVASPRSRVQVLGFPIAGSTLQLQVVDARPNATATFYIGNGPASAVIGTQGTMLVDTAGAVTRTTTTDGNGAATIVFDLPATLRNGHQFFAQCATMAGTPTATEMSSAVSITVGDTYAPVEMNDHLEGSVRIQGPGSAASGPVSGILSSGWRRGTQGAQYLGAFAVHASTARVDLGTTVVEGLRLIPGADDYQLRWNARNFLTTPPSSATTFMVAFRSGRIDHGPFTVPGNLSVSGTAVQVTLDPINNPDAGPLQGRQLVYTLEQRHLGVEHFSLYDRILGAGDTIDAAAAAAITPNDVEQGFDQAEAAMLAILQQLGGDTSMFQATMPNYSQFFADEQRNLLQLTNGRASTLAELMAMVDEGEITESLALQNIVVGKLLAALGVTDIVKAFDEVMAELCASELKEVGDHLKGRAVKKAGQALGKVVKKILSKEFIKKLTEKAGEKMVGKTIKAIAGKCVPGWGWTWFLIRLAWAILEQLF